MGSARLDPSSDSNVDINHRIWHYDATCVSAAVPELVYGLGLKRCDLERPLTLVGLMRGVTKYQLHKQGYDSLAGSSLRGILIPRLWASLPSSSEQTCYNTARDVDCTDKELTHNLHPRA